MKKRVAFTDDGARRIIAATRAYERGNRDQPPIKFRQVGGDDGGAVFRDAELTSDVSPTDYFNSDLPPEVANAKLLDLQPGEDENIAVTNPLGLRLQTGTKVIVAQGRYEWGIVAVNYATVYGFDAAKNQVLAHGTVDIGSGSPDLQGGILFWLDTTECPEGGSS